MRMALLAAFGLLAAGCSAPSEHFQSVQVGTSQLIAELGMGEAEEVNWKYEERELQITFRHGKVHTWGHLAPDNKMFPIATDMTEQQVRSVLGGPKEVCKVYTLEDEERVSICFVDGRVVSKDRIERYLNVHYRSCAPIVFFDWGSTVLLPKAIEGLGRQLAGCFAEPGRVSVKIAGHADNTGDPAANMALSLARARVVRDFVLALGVPPSSIEIFGFGDRQPLSLNTGDEMQNRRVEVHVERR